MAVPNRAGDSKRVSNASDLAAKYRNTLIAGGTFKPGSTTSAPADKPGRDTTSDRMRYLGDD